MKTTEWIDVRDRLPVIGVPVWVYDERIGGFVGEMHATTYDCGRTVMTQISWRAQDRLEDVTPTHWQPLPEPPTKETKHECCSAAKKCIKRVNATQWVFAPSDNEPAHYVHYCPWCGEKLEKKTTLAVDEILQAIQDRKDEIVLALMEKTEKAKTCQNCCNWKDAVLNHICYIAGGSTPAKCSCDEWRLK